MARSVLEFLPTIPSAVHQEVAAAATTAGHVIARTSPEIVVEMTGDLTAAGTSALPSTARPGDMITAKRTGAGDFTWTVGGEVLRFPGEHVRFVRTTTSAWAVIPMRDPSAGYTEFTETSGGITLNLATTKRWVYFSGTLASTLTVTLPTVGVPVGEWRTFFRLGGGFNVAFTPVTGDPVRLRGKREMVTLVWTGSTWRAFHRGPELSIQTETGTSIVYSFDTHSGTWTELSATSAITIKFPSTTQTQSETLWYVRPHTAPRTITLAAGDAPDNATTFEGPVGNVLTVPANSTFMFRTKVIRNTVATGGTAIVYIEMPGSGAGGGGIPSDGSITAAKFAVEAPILVTGPLTTTLAHHRQTLEIAMSASASITLAQLGAGVEYEIHRPWDQPAVALVPPVASGVYSEPLGFNGIARGGTVRVRQNNSNRPKLAGDIVWRGRPVAAEFAAMVDFADLRAGVGIVAPTANQVDSWTSTGIGTAVYSQGTVSAKPILNADGSLRFTLASLQRLTINKTTYSGNAIALMFAYRLITPSAGSSWLFFNGAAATSTYIYYTLDSATNDQLRVRNGGTETALSTNFPATQEYRVVVHVLDRINQRNYRMSNSMHATASNVYTAQGTGANMPNWTTWNVTTTNNRLASSAAASVCVFDLYGFSLIESANAAIVDATTPNMDFMTRLLGMGRGLFPLGADG